MARSKYIYVVREPCATGEVIATFTVKRELISWLEVRVMKDGVLARSLRILRYLDGASGKQSGVPVPDAWKAVGLSGDE